MSECFINGIVQYLKQQATGWTIEESRLDSRKRQEIFLYSITFRQLPEGTQPPIKRVPGALTPVVKLQGRHLHLVPSLMNVELCLHSLVSLDGVLLN
jgi:hypothetical protein